MMTFYGLRQGRLVRLDHAPASGLPAPTDVLWIDLLDPSREDERAVETLLGLAVPTRQEMAEIEESARLYEDNGSLVMTAVGDNGGSEANTARSHGYSGFMRFSRSPRLSASWMLAACTTTPSSSPSVSTATWRLRPLRRLAASQPRGPPLSVVFTLWVSMIAAVGLASRPAPSRSMTTKWWRMLSHSPSGIAPRSAPSPRPHRRVHGLCQKSGG